MNKLIHFFSLLILFSFLACNRKIEYEFPDLNLYPIQKGKYRIYQVIDTTYTTQGSIPKFYYKKEETDSNETDLKNRTISRLNIYKGNHLDSLTFSELWTQYKDAKWAERIEGNTKYLVLKFPVKLNDSWNGNEFNNNGIENFVYLNIDTTVTINNITYPHCVYVQQRLNNTSLLNEINTYEIYAPGIGKIKRYDNYKKYNLNPNGTRSLTTDSYFYEETLLEHNY
jgi:hypothetical protein